MAVGVIALVALGAGPITVTDSLGRGAVAGPDAVGAARTSEPVMVGGADGDDLVRLLRITSNGILLAGAGTSNTTSGQVDSTGVQFMPARASQRLIGINAQNNGAQNRTFELYNGTSTADPEILHGAADTASIQYTFPGAGIEIPDGVFIDVPSPGDFDFTLYWSAD